MSTLKSKNRLIDSEATHHFFFSHDSCTRYKQIEHETVEATSENARIVGKGYVWIPLTKGIFIEAIHVRSFSSKTFFSESSVQQSISTFLQDFTHTTDALSSTLNHKASFSTLLFGTVSMK